MKKVFDASAFLNRFFFNDIENVITTNSVMDEIKNREQKQQIENLILNRKISIQDPQEKYIKQIKQNCPKGLSKTDIEVIALAKELSLELHTDDFLMRKACKIHKIKVKEVSYKMEEDTLEDIYEKIKPTKEELKAVEKTAKEIIEKLNNSAKKLRIKVSKILLAGSAARGTFLHNKKDLDIFLLFDKKLRLEEIKQNNELILKDAFPKTIFREEYGEHPYLKASLYNQNIDFVPGFFIKNIKEKKSSVDRTPLHLEFLNKNQNKETKKQVILLKQFLKNNLLYGADQKNNGFSGYLTELFILKYKTFESTIKKFSEIENNKYLFINEPKIKKKFEDYFVFLDPTDENRNVASSISRKNWKILSEISKQYSKNKNNDFFFGNIYNKELPKNMICFKIEAKGKTEDSNWGIIKRIAKILANELNSKNYAIKKYAGILKEDIGLIFLTSELKEILRGPLIKDEKNTKAFKKKHKNYYIENNRIYSEIKFTKKEIVLEAKKILKRIANKYKEINYNSLKLTKDEEKRLKKEFL